MTLQQRLRQNRMTTINKIKQWIDEAHTVAILPHMLPDGDAAGCAIAMALLLSKLNKKVRVVCDSPLPDKLSALPHADIFATAKEGTFDLAIAVDCSSPALMGTSYAIFAQTKRTIVIDHHMTGELLGDIVWREEASANAEHIYDLIANAYPALLDSDIAECLYTGLVTDSGGFGWGSVTAHTHRVAAACIAAGAGAEKVYYKQIKELPLRVIRSRAEAYEKALYMCNNQVAFVVFDLALQRKYNLVMDDFTGSLVEMMRCNEILFAFGLVEMEKGRFRISARSRGDYSAAAVCEAFGGGGHLNAAGCRLNGDAGIVIDMLLDEVYKQL